MSAPRATNSVAGTPHAAAPLLGHRGKKGGAVSYTGYWIDKSHIFGPRGYTQHWIDKEHIFGPRGYTQHWIDNGHIFGPQGCTQCWIADGHIYGPKDRLPWSS